MNTRKQWTWWKQQSSDLVEPNAFYPKKIWVQHILPKFFTLAQHWWRCKVRHGRQVLSQEKLGREKAERWYLCYMFVGKTGSYLLGWQKPWVLRTWHQNQRNCYRPRWGVSMERLSKLKPEGPNFPEMLYVSCQGLPMTLLVSNGSTPKWIGCCYVFVYDLEHIELNKQGGAFTKAQNISKHDVVATHAPRNNT